MTINPQELTNDAAVEALCEVARQWIRSDGLEVYQVYHNTRSLADEKYNGLPTWIKDKPKEITDEAGEFARQMLKQLSNPMDASEVEEWTTGAIKKVEVPKLHMIDPLTLGIGGLILIGAILAARVKKVGSAEFYEGIPENLADVLKAGSSIVPLDA